MPPLTTIALFIPLAGCSAVTAVLARSVLAQRRTRYFTRLQAEWQIVLALFEKDPHDEDYMRPVSGHIKAEDMKTLLEHLARESFEIDYVKGLRREIPRQVSPAAS